MTATLPETVSPSAQAKLIIPCPSPAQEWFIIKTKQQVIA